MVENQSGSGSGLWWKTEAEVECGGKWKRNVVEGRSGSGMRWKVGAEAESSGKPNYDFFHLEFD